MPDAERLGDNFVMVAFVVEIKAIHQVECLAVEQADREQVRAQIENQVVLTIRILERIGIELSRAEPPRLDRQPAIGLLFLVSLKHKVAIFPTVKVPQLGKSLLHLLKK